MILNTMVDIYIYIKDEIIIIETYIYISISIYTHLNSADMLS